MASSLDAFDLIERLENVDFLSKNLTNRRHKVDLSITRQLTKLNTFLKDAVKFEDKNLSLPVSFNIHNFKFS